MTTHDVDHAVRWVALILVTPFLVAYPAAAVAIYLERRQVAKRNLRLRLERERARGGR